MAPARELPIHLSEQHFCSYCGPRPEALEQNSRRKSHGKKRAYSYVDNGDLSSNWEEEMPPWDVSAIKTLSSNSQDDDALDFEFVNLFPDSAEVEGDFEVVHLPWEGVEKRKLRDPWLTWEAGELVELKDLEEEEMGSETSKADSQWIPQRLRVPTCIPKCSVVRLVALTTWSVFVGVSVFLGACWCFSIQY